MRALACSDFPMRKNSRICAGDGLREVVPGTRKPFSHRRNGTQRSSYGIYSNLAPRKQANDGRAITPMSPRTRVCSIGCWLSTRSKQTYPKPCSMPTTRIAIDRTPIGRAFIFSESQTSPPTSTCVFLSAPYRLFGVITEITRCDERSLRKKNRCPSNVRYWHLADIRLGERNSGPCGHCSGI